MEAIIYVLIFIMGTLFGSFCTLAVYRIPQGLDILHEHSFCPNCGSKLKFIDLIPILSYLGLKGKCRYCGKKVRIRYLLLEVLLGAVFVLLTLSLKLDLYNLSVDQIIHFSFLILYIVGLFIIAGIDKEKISINRFVLSYEIILGICFMTYVCIAKAQVIYTYIIVLGIISLVLIADVGFLKKKLTENYTIGILVLALCMITFTSAEIFYYTIALALILAGFSGILEKIRNSYKSKAVVKFEDKKELQIPIGFYLVISNIVLLLISNFLK